MRDTSIRWKAAQSKKITVLDYNTIQLSSMSYFFEWNKMMTDLILTCTVCILPIRKSCQLNVSGNILGNLRIFFLKE